MNWDKVKVNDVVLYISPDAPTDIMIGHITEIEYENIHISDIWEMDCGNMEDMDEWVLSLGDDKLWFELVRVIDNIKDITAKDIQNKFPEYTL